MYTIKRTSIFKTKSVFKQYIKDKKHLKKVGPIRHCEPPHA